VRDDSLSDGLCNKDVFFGVSVSWLLCVGLGESVEADGSAAAVGARNVFQRSRSCLSFRGLGARLILICTCLE
jgi:hypothetical protein